MYIPLNLWLIHDTHDSIYRRLHPVLYIQYSICNIITIYPETYDFRQQIVPHFSGGIDASENINSQATFMKLRRHSSIPVSIIFKLDEFSNIRNKKITIGFTFFNAEQFKVVKEVCGSNYKVKDFKKLSMDLRAEPACFPAGYRLQWIEKKYAESMTSKDSSIELSLKLRRLDKQYTYGSSK
jgi:hypothetical protein